MDIFVICHQHYDFLWHKSSKVFAKTVCQNLKWALEIINKNPDFRFLIDQAIIVEFFRKFYPENYRELKQRIEEGKIEIVCGGYVMPDLNLPGGESLILQFLLAKKYFQKWFGKDPKVLWLIDSFGQSGQLPQIAKKLGFKYYLFKRGISKQIPSNLIFEGVDGSRILSSWLPAGYSVVLPPPFVTFPSRHKPWRWLEKIIKLFFPILAPYALYFPNFTLGFSTLGRYNRFTKMIKELKRYSGQNEILLPYGGDLVPPSDWISYLCKFYSKFSKNRIFLGRVEDYFKSIEGKVEFWVKGELNGPAERLGQGVFPGCFSSRIEIKNKLRKSERLLYQAEALSLLNFLIYGRSFQTKQLWKEKLINDCHDAVCGCFGDENYPEIMERYQKIERESEKIIDQVLKRIAKGEVVFNPLPWSRIDLIEKAGKLRLIKSLALGFSQSEEIKIKKSFRIEEGKLITPFYQVKFDQKEIEIFYQGKKISGQHFGEIRIQQDLGDSYLINASDSFFAKIEKITLKELNPYRAILEIKTGAGKIEIYQNLIFYSFTPRIDFLTKIKNQRKYVRVQACLSFNEKFEKITREIPAGFIVEGQSTGMESWREFRGSLFARGNFDDYDRIKPVQNWLFLGKDQGFAIFNDGLPEHEIQGNKVFLTLLRAFGWITNLGDFVILKTDVGKPIPLAQQQGEFELRYALMPISREKVARESLNFAYPLIFKKGEGNLESFSLFDFGEGISPLAVRVSGGKILLRIVENEGKKRKVEIGLNQLFHNFKVKITDLTEEVVLKELQIKNGKICFKILPQEILTLTFEK